VAAGGLPVINIAGCPIHPGWFVDVVLQLAAGEVFARGPR
jgi:Ni,Fe-hydrogenase I small subunit